MIQIKLNMHFDVLSFPRRKCLNLQIWSHAKAYDYTALLVAPLRPVRFYFGFIRYMRHPAVPIWKAVVHDPPDMETNKIPTWSKLVTTRQTSRYETEADVTAVENNSALWWSWKMTMIHFLFVTPVQSTQIVNVYLQQPHSRSAITSSFPLRKVNILQTMAWWSREMNTFHGGKWKLWNCLCHDAILISHPQMHSRTHRHTQFPTITDVNSKMKSCSKMKLHKFRSFGLQL